MMVNPDRTLKVSQSKPTIISRLKSFFSALIDVRVGLFILAIGVFFYEGAFPSFSWFDDACFHAGLFFKTEPITKVNPVIITFPRETLNQLSRDPDHCTDLFAVLKKLKHASPASVALVLSRPPMYGEDLTVSAIESNLRQMKDKAKAEVKPVLDELLNDTEHLKIRGETLADNLYQTDVILGITFKDGDAVFNEGQFGQSMALDVNPERMTTYWDFLPDIAIPSRMPTLSSQPQTSVWKGPVAPVRSGTKGSAWPLVWRENDRYVPDLVSLMYAHSLKTHPVWEKDSGMTFGFSFVHTDPRGMVKTRFRTPGGEDSDIIRRTAKEIRKARDMSIIKKRAVFMGAEHDPSLEKAALAYLGLSSGAVSYEPYLALWAGKVLIIGLFVYLVIILPLFRTGTALMMSLVMAGALLVFQMAYHLVTDQFLPLSHVLAYLAIGHSLMAIRLAVAGKIAFLEGKSQAAYYELGHFQYDQSRFDQAFNTLKHCRPEVNVLELLYKLAVSLERKRQFDKARNVFDHIIALNPGYRDCRERSDQLGQVLYGRVQTGASGQTAQVSNLARSVLGRYELEREVGRGAMGVVYLGQDPKIGRLIAIKTMDFTQTFEGRFDEVKDRFFREAMAAGRLNHPNIVTIYDAGEEQDLAYIAMDYVDGKPLNEFSRPETLLPVPVVFHIMAQVAGALDYAHSQQIIHRDIKPGNIIYNPQTHVVKVTDFGIARIADTTTTRPGVVLGSPSFMAPEQLKGQEMDGRADIFSLGVTFYQLLTGTLPFRGEDLASLGYQITQGKHVQVSSLRPDLPKIADSIIDKALQKNPDKRYKTAGGMARSLRTVLDKGNAP